MIARVWRGRSTVTDGPRYVEHLEESVFPQLRQIQGHRSAHLLQRPVGDRVEFMVISVWESIEAIRQFAGDDLDTPVVEPAGRAGAVRFRRTRRSLCVGVTLNATRLIVPGGLDARRS
jgi:heme-degrading monooxygenase HmoA